MPETADKPDDEGRPRPRSRRRYLRWLLIMLVAVMAALVWFNGPGLRWLAPKAAAYFLRDSEMRVEFRLEGSLTSGLSVRDLHLVGGTPLAELTADRVSVSYQIGKALRGRIDRIEIDGLHADLALGPDVEKTG